MKLPNIRNIIKRSFFDNLVIFYILLLIACFLGMYFFTDYNVEKTLLSERSNSMVNQMRLVASQSIDDYFKGKITDTELSRKLQSFNSTLQAEIWVLDTKKNLIAYSESDMTSANIANINSINSTLNISNYGKITGDYYGYFSESHLSIGVPLVDDDTQVGYCIMHASITDITEIEENIQHIILLAFLVVLLISLFLLYHFTRKVLNPIDRINKVAYDYSNGIFTEKTDINDDNEIGQLASSLDNMADELQKVEDYRRDFISNVSHDFRSPLTSIKGYLEAIQDGTIPPEMQSHYIDVVINETNRLTKLTSGLLQLKDFNNKALIVKKKPFDINRVILSAIETQTGNAEKKRLTLTAHISEGKLTVFADPDKISQVINNLLDNAIKFSNPDSEIILTARSESGNSVFISVKDAGEGISKEQQKHIWERFYKGDSSRGRDKVGSGLGLAIVYEIIAAHGQEITLNSEPGKGSEFSFHLQKTSSK